MRLIFAGTPEFARVALAQLHTAGFEIPLVLTQPDRPAGRGMKLQASPVKQFAQENGIAVAQPRSLRLDGKFPEDAAAALLAIEAARADAMVVAAYGLILPQWVLDAPPLGCFNIHASLLPRWRGAAPIHRAIEAGDAETGIIIMQMDAGLDTGDMLLLEKLAISPDDTTATLHDRLAAVGGRMIVKALELTSSGELVARKQPESGVNYANKIEKNEAVIDWAASSALIERRVRAFNPFPVAVSTLAGVPVKFWQVTALGNTARPESAVPGQILAVGPEGVDIAARQGVVRATRLQKPGGKPLEAAEFVRGFAMQPGMVFQSTAVKGEGS
ncbi:MAG TPA: methionyl-tRNA formyltransferase [Polaromonas sp.]|uniref:methionyl-tRNA formyltransferase n=1 Tax=Polaromonas sp. TaxID=1869339 RepID=UPI002D308D96|nr:methionyl-tRNA formyltransferase [Polaromonas sp.]HYW56990.1 methionyl-tRNA formyltransferase [Polaromonas sp.]